MKKTLLDLGCGYAEYHKNYPNYDIIGIDIDKKAIEEARENFPDNQYYVGSACESLEFISGHKFDVVLAFDVLEHVLKPRRLIENMLRYVKEGGYCHLISPSALAYEINYRFHKGQNKINTPTMQYLTPAVVCGIINRIGGKVTYQNIGSKYWIRPIIIKFIRLEKELYYVKGEGGIC